MVEYRLANQPVSLGARASANGVAQSLEGYAAVFNSEAVIAGLWRERIAPNAFADSLKKDDVLARFNHLEDRLLGRISAGTLTVREDAKGLFYRVAVNQQDPLAVSAAAQAARGDLAGSSFAFEPVAPEDEEWIAPRARGELPLRILWRLRLVDVAPRHPPRLCSDDYRGP